MVTNKDQKYNDYYEYYLYLILCSDILLEGKDNVF